MPYYLNLALDSGVKPGEVSEIITHLAFYSGWGNAMSAVAVANDVFAQARSGADQLPPASPDLLPLDKEAEAKRAANVEQQFGAVARDSCSTPPTSCSTTCGCARASRRGTGAWSPSRARRLRAGREVPFHLNRAMDNGLTQAQAAEAITHLAFYASWPNAISALPVAKDVFEKRPK